jgi:hypothetical protein
VSWRLRDDAPEWLKDAVFEAHAPGAMLPDRWRFSFARDALRRIAHAEPDDTRQTIMTKILPDVHYRELVTWLGSTASRQSYCEDARAAEGDFNTPAELLAAGQVRERQMVCEIIWDTLATVDQR